MVDKKEEARTFYAYINRNGTLHNNGMVATGPFIAQLDRSRRHPPVPRPRGGPRLRRHAVLEDGGERLPVGFRKLGMAHLKGLEQLSVYEIVDAAAMAPEELKEIPGRAAARRRRA